ncbi:MAG: hypothetical protein ACKVP3_23750 [Hyphomicrobiaceae bacterium]
MASGRGWIWTAIAISSVIWAAIFFHAFQRVRGKMAASLYLVASLTLVGANFLNALGNSAHRSEGSRRGYAGVMTAADDREASKIKLSHRRQEQARVAGEQAVATIEAEIEAAKSGEAWRWRNTAGCDVDKTKGEENRRYCSSIKALGGKLAAAKARDAADAELKQLAEQQAVAGPKPTTVDPFVDAVADIVGAMGFTPQRELIGTIRDLAWALTVELVAALGPGAAFGLLCDARAPAPAASKRRARSTTAAKVDPEAGVQAFTAARLEEREGAVSTSAALWVAWERYRSEYDLPLVSRTKFGLLMGQLFEKLGDSRPRYRVAIKTELRVVASN